MTCRELQRDAEIKWNLIKNLKSNKPIIHHYHEHQRNLGSDCLQWSTQFMASSNTLFFVIDTLDIRTNISTLFLFCGEFYCCPRNGILNLQNQAKRNFHFVYPYLHQLICHPVLSVRVKKLMKYKKKYNIYLVVF